MDAQPSEFSRDQYGFTLLEALVTLVIVSIGLLGLLGLQTVSIMNTQLSGARTQATLAADNIADRMRANREGVLNNDYDGVDHPSAGRDEPDKSCAGQACSPGEMATFDAFVWDQSLDHRLPRGEGALECIEQDGSACLRYRVTVRWQERGDVENNGATTMRTFETVVQP